MRLTRRRLRRLIMESIEEEEILVGQEIPEHLLKSWLVGSIDDDYKDLTGHRYGKESLARMDLNQLKDLHIAINYELETRADEERDEKELGADLAASELDAPFELPKQVGMSRPVNEFAGAMRMARGGSSPMKSRADPEFARLIKKKKV